MSHRPLRAAAYVAAPALVLAGLVATPAPAHAAADPRPVTIGADWLAGQLTDGVVVNDQFDFPDYGLSVDAGLALDAVGGQDETIQEIADAIAANLDSYTTYTAFTGDDPAGTHVSAGAIAKALTFAQVAGRDATSYGGTDLVADLGERVSTETATRGRIADVVVEGADFEGDFANTIGQSFAARGLAIAGDPLAEPVTDYLLAQQCEEGFFRLSFAAPDATDQTCDADAAATPDVDVTGLALVNLVGQADDPAVRTAIQDGLDWLESVQNADGSFSGSPPTDAPNANSTGLAGWALGGADRTAAAERAATWLRGHQADDPSACRTGLTGAARGAIAYDDDALAAGRANGITDDSQDQFRRGTAQALPALAYAPAGIGSPSLVSPDRFRRAGAREIVGSSGFGPGTTVCFSGAGLSRLVTATDTGVARTPVTLPGRTRTTSYQATTGASIVGTVTYRTLAATTPRVDYKRRPVRGTNQRVTVSGLVRGESVTVVSRGRVVDRGTVNSRGRYTARFGVGNKIGKAGLTVRGEFGNRKASRSFVVIRGR